MDKDTFEIASLRIVEVVMLRPEAQESEILCDEFVHHIKFGL